MIGDIFNGAVISVEHLLMVILGGAGASVLASRLTKLRIQINGRLTKMEDRLVVLESEKANGGEEPRPLSPKGETLNDGPQD